MDDSKNSDFSHIQKSANIVEIIKDYVPLEPHGKNYFGVCPFHDDHSPSMSVSPDKQIYKCFVCGATGNVFTFLENFLGISFLEAVKIVADKVGINFTITSSGKNEKNKKYYDIMNLATLFYQNNLRTPLGVEAREYLQKRGLTEEVIKDFQIGLSLSDTNSLYKLLSNKKIPKKDMEDVGLIASSNEDDTYDLFRNRIMFPLKNPSGQVVGFSGRIYNTVSNSKYINTKETIIFKKGETLFNYDLAINSARLNKFIIICEGQMDAIRIYASGIKSVVATMGTALTKEHIALLKKIHVKVIIVMDNDAAGELSTMRLGESLIAEDVDIGVVRLAGKKDPDEYILAYGIDAFRDNINNPLTYLEFMDNYLRKNRNLKNPVDLSEFINDYINMLSKFKDDILISASLNKLADEFHLDRSLLESRFKNKDIAIGIKAPEEVAPKMIKEREKINNKFNKAFEVLLYYMMNSTDAMRMFLRSKLDLPKCKYRLVSNNLIYYFELEGEIDFAEYLTFSLKFDEVSPVVKEIIEDVRIDNFTLEDVEAAIKIIKDILDKEKINKLKGELSSELDVNRKRQLMESIYEIKKGSVNDGRD